MSRRHHGGRPHRLNGPSRPTDTARPAPPAPSHPDEQTSAPAAAGSWPDAPVTMAPATADERSRAMAVPPIGGASAMDGHTIDDPAPIASDHAPGMRSAPPDGPPGSISPAGPSTVDGEEGGGQSPDVSTAPANASRPANGQAYGVGGPCTAPQLRRFIKSRPYVPMHELRRRFGINGSEDDVTQVELAGGRVYVGLPSREGSLLGELLRGGEVGYELSLDPRSPVVVGLYPMRPVARP